MEGGITFKKSHNDFHNILRLFDALPNFHFSASETMRDYEHRAASRFAKRLLTLRILGN